MSGAPVAGLLLAAIVITSVVALSYRPSLLQAHLFRPYWISRHRNYHTWITSAFIHGDYAHLLFNALTFWSFGFALERTIGSARFLALYAVALLVSDLGTYIRHRDQPDYASLGASGAILAVLFASIIYFPTQSLFIFPLPVPIPAPLFALVYLGYTIYASRAQTGRINHDAHLGGAITGLVFVLLTDPDAVRNALALLF